MTPKTLKKPNAPALEELLKTLHDSQDPDQEVLRSLSEAFLMASDDKAWAEATRGLGEAIRVHRDRLAKLLDRDPGEVVTALDYLVNEIKDPRRILRLRNAALAQAARLALVDSLTGLHNLIYLELMLPSRLERARESRQTLSFVMLDLHGFGAFNKKFGHLGGNQALCQVAETLKGLLPPGGVAGRFGGDEFWVLLPGLNRRSGRTFLEKVDQVLAASPVNLPEGGQAPALRAGMGLATFPADGAQPDVLMAHADRALVATKQDRSRNLRLHEPASRALLTWKPATGRTMPSKISAAGDFNGWDADADPLAQDPLRGWSLALPLEPGRYAYKFVIDGRSWEPDPRAEESAPDGFGGVNSVLHVRG